MRYLVRLPKPNILEQREISWTQSFIISGKDRPDNSKYSHLEIQIVEDELKKNLAV